MDKELSFHVFQRIPDLAHKSVLKQISVLPFDPYLAVLN